MLKIFLSLLLLSSSFALAQQSPLEKAEVDFKDGLQYLSAYIKTATHIHMAEYIQQYPQASEAEAAAFSGQKVLLSLQQMISSCYKNDAVKREKELCPYLDIQHTFFFTPTSSNAFFKRHSSLNAATQKWMQQHPAETGLIYGGMEKLMGQQ